MSTFFHKYKQFFLSKYFHFFPEYTMEKKRKIIFYQKEKKKKTIKIK